MLQACIKNKFVNGKTCADKFRELENKHRNGALIEHAKEYFKNISVMTTYGTHRLYKVLGLNFDKTIKSSSIIYKRGDVEEEITLEMYYDKVYGIKIKYP